MGKKKGPCFHCGIDSTPLWRNGPPDKPVLCNACGSRYRIGKPLENYTPKHSHLVKRSRKRKAPIFPSDRHNSNNPSLVEDYPSSESSTSHNHSHIPSRFKQENINGNHGINYPVVGSWGSSVWRPGLAFPTRRRTPVVYGARLTALQKLKRDLHSMLRDGGCSSTEFVDQGKLGQEDGVLIYENGVNKLRIPPTEIGLGIILLNDNSTYQDQQQEIIDQPCPSQLDIESDQKSSPSVANVSSDDVKAGEIENTNMELDNDCASPTMGAAEC